MTAEQTAILKAAGERVELRDPDGNMPEAKRRLASIEPRYPAAVVEARLQSMQAEWDSLGGFDEAYLKSFLAKLRAA